MSFERVKRVFVEDMCLDADEITPQARLVDLDLDSLDWADLQLELEDEFGMEIPDDDLKTIFTVQDIVTYADSRSKPV